MTFLEELEDRKWAMIGVAIAAGAIGVLLYRLSQKKRPDSAPAFVKPNSRPTSHTKARSSPYPRQPDLNRYPVPENKVSWDAKYPEYDPVDYTAPSVASKPVWADPDYKNDAVAKPAKWNHLDGKIDRTSHTGQYLVVNKLPRNPIGRTGMCSRGLLGKWGPNHAADPIVTRWKRDAAGRKVVHPDTGRPVAQFVSIQRKDSGEWALPGGMVDAGDNVSITLRKEFAEEAMNSLEQNERDQQHIDELVKKCFHNECEIYRGYVDDPRNTDNAWMETVAVNFHDDTGDGAGQFSLHAGDDAGQVKWTDLDKDLQLYASHSSFVKAVADRLNCHW